jgi:hypothetical protein
MNMYISGNKSNMASRLHQLGTGASQLVSFRTEGRSYLTGTYDRLLSGKWEREARQQQFRFSGAAGLTTQQF